MSIQQSMQLLPGGFPGQPKDEGILLQYEISAMLANLRPRAAHVTQKVKSLLGHVRAGPL